MKKIAALLFIGMISTLSACSTSSLKRTGYEALQGAQEQQCRNDLNADCTKQKSYDAYQEDLQELERLDN